MLAVQTILVGCCTHEIHPSLSSFLIVLPQPCLPFLPELQGTKIATVPRKPPKFGLTRPQGTLEGPAIH